MQCHNSTAPTRQAQKFDSILWTHYSKEQRNQQSVSSCKHISSKWLSLTPIPKPACDDHSIPRTEMLLGRVDAFDVGLQGPLTPPVAPAFTLQSLAKSHRDLYARGSLYLLPHPATKVTQSRRLYRGLSLSNSLLTAEQQPTAGSQAYWVLWRGISTSLGPCWYVCLLRRSWFRDPG